MARARRESAADALRFIGLAVGVFVAVNVAGEAIRGPFDTVPQWITLPGPRWLRLLTEAFAAAALVVGPFAARLPAQVRAAAALLLATLAAMLKMLFDRTGMRAYTVPAPMRYRLRKEPYFVAREIVAYYHSFLLE